MDWQTIKAEYIAGGTSYRVLAEKYGVSFSTLKEIARREKWTDLKEKAYHKADTKFANLVGAKQAARFAKINNVADKLLDKMERALDSLDEMGSTTLKNFTSALKDLRDIKGVKSELDLREQEARIEKLQKETLEENKHGGNNLTVTFVGEVEKYGD